MKKIKHLFSTNGRSGRLEYFLHTTSDVVFIVLMLNVVSFAYVQFGIEISEATLVLNILFILVVGFFAEICVAVRRFHDLGMSGWYLLGTMVPFYNIYLALILLFKNGQPDENQYGPANRC